MFNAKIHQAVNFSLAKNKAYKLLNMYKNYCNAVNIQPRQQKSCLVNNRSFHKIRTKQQCNKHVVMQIKPKSELEMFNKIIHQNPIIV